MNFIQWLQDLGVDADPVKAGFQAKLLYLVVCAAMPVVLGAVVGFGLRAIESIFGVELGKGGH